MKSVQISVLASAVGVALLGAGLTSDLWASTSNTQAADMVAQAGGAQVQAGRYIITFSEKGLVSYTGGVAGLQGTAPVADGVSSNSSRKLDVNSSAAHSYRNYLSSQRAMHIAAIEQKLGRPLTVRYTYDVTRNAISADMSAAEAARIADVAGIAHVAPVKVLQPDTFRGPTFIGANTIWDGTGVPSYDSATKGQGIKIGVIDTGANSAHPSFANDPTCGFSASNPKLIAKDCIASSTCQGLTPEADDGNGHGVHTSSTAGGNTIDNTVTPAPLLPDGITMSGVAPCAQVHTYKICNTSGCDSDAITAAIQNAIIDQVDVINYSIGPTCGGGNPWDDSLDFLGAEGADVFVAASAGNTRATCTNPTGLVANNGPWMMTVAASTQDEVVSPQISATGPGTPPPATQNIALNPGSTSLQPAQTVNLTGVPLRTNPANPIGCTAAGGIAAGYFGAADIAILRRGSCSFAEKITNAYNAGARTVLIGNNQVGSISMNTTGVPADVAAFSMQQIPGDALIAFVDANEPPAPNADAIFADGFDGPSPTAGATGDYVRAAIGMTQGDVLAGFSFRGPTPPPYDNLTKPDITGPGVNIYAAFDAAEGSYGLLSGTSMSSPHLAGAGALVRAVQPSWSPMEVKSAIQTTATLSGVEQDGTTPWNLDDVGSGRVDLTKATRAGVTLDESPDNFAAANPTGGTVDMRNLNIASLRNTSCDAGCSWTRKFKNRLNASGTWTPTAIDPPGYHLTFSPASITMGPGFVTSITITATATGPMSATLAYGRVDLHESNSLSPDQHLTVAVKAALPVISVTPATLTSTQGPNTTTTAPVTVANTGGGTLTWNVVTSAGPPPCGALWLSLAPASGSDIGGANTAVTATFDSTGLAAGTYTTNACFSSNDATTPMTAVPVTLTVTSTPALVFTQDFDDITTLAGLGWLQINHSSPVGSTGWFQGSAATFPAFNGVATAYIGANFNNTTGANTISNWLVTPSITFTSGSSFAFYTRKATPAPTDYPDRLQVRLCTDTPVNCSNVGATETDVGNFTNLLLDINPTLTAGGYPVTWTQFTIPSASLPTSGTGRIAMRYFVTGGGPSGNNSDFIGIDNVVITAAAITSIGSPSGPPNVAPDSSQTGAR
ncbi:MAG: S8 family serine peptidase [Dokdonella sp.]